MNGLYIAVILFLVWNSVRDIGKREIVPITVVLFVLFRWIYFGVHCQNSGMGIIQEVLFVLVGIVPGIVVLILGIISRGQLGLGDAVIIIVAGLYLGLEKTVISIMWALLFAFFGGVVLLLLKKGTTKTIPFVPFFLAGTIAGICC